MFGLIVEKELKEIFSSRRFAVTFGIVSLLIVLAFYVGGKSYEVSRAQVEAAAAESLRQLEGQTDWLEVLPSIQLPPEPLAALVTGLSGDVGRNIRMLAQGPLQPLESRYGEDPILATFRFLDLEFIFQVVLSLFAILFAFDAVSGEKERGTLRLALAQAVPRDTWILGKITGGFLGLTVPLAIPFAMGALILVVMGVPMDTDAWWRLGLVILAGGLYVGAFLGLSVLVSTLTHRSATSFLFLLVAWIFAVLVVPRGAVLLAARAVEVPSVDAALSQRSRLRSQLWREDRKEMERTLDEVLRSAGDGEGAEAQAEMSRRVGQLNTFLQSQSEERNRKLDALDARLQEERRNRQAVQERLAFALARLSPAAAFSLAALDLAGTSLTLPQGYLDQARAYQQVFAAFQKEKTGGRSSSGIRVAIAVRGEGEEARDQPIDVSELPVFEYRPPSAAQVFRAATFDLTVLALFNILFFTSATFAFGRYDVR